MIELVGYGGVAFFAIQVSQNRVLSFVPTSAEVPGAVVSPVHLRSAYRGAPSFEWLHTINDFVVESWVIR